jgi:hypothetical protein
MPGAGLDEAGQGTWPNGGVPEPAGFFTVTDGDGEIVTAVVYLAVRLGTNTVV